MKVYWFPEGPDKPCYEADGVPDDSVAFVVGAPCMLCMYSFLVLSIDRQASLYGCGNKHDREIRYHRIPVKTHTPELTEAGFMIRVDNHPAVGEALYIKGRLVSS